jgi:hypothetical protein
MQEDRKEWVEPKREDFVINPRILESNLVYHPEVNGNKFVLDPETMIGAMIEMSRCIRIQFDQFDVWRRSMPVPPIWDGVLPKNKNGAYAECLGITLCSILDKQGIRLIKNSVESGSPDFFPECEHSDKYIENPEEFEGKYYHVGGLETKSCQCRTFMKAKPSSHHRMTNNAMTVMIEYFEECVDPMPWFMGLLFANNLKQEDWSETSKPKDAKSRLTNSSRLLPSGLEKCRMGWVVLHKYMKLPESKKDIEKYGLEPLVGLKNKFGIPVKTPRTRKNS